MGGLGFFPCILFAYRVKFFSCSNELQPESTDRRNKMFTALNPTEFAAVMSANRVFRESPKSDWEMAHALDAAGDRFKAAGNLKAAQACYSRALARATKAHNAAK